MLRPTPQKLNLTPPKAAGKKNRTPTAGPEKPTPGHRARQKASRKAPDNRGLSATNEYAEMFESIRGLASGIQALYQRAVREYTPIVEAILRSPIPDIQHIEHTLDGPARLLWLRARTPPLQKTLPLLFWHRPRRNGGIYRSLS